MTSQGIDRSIIERSHHLGRGGFAVGRAQGKRPCLGVARMQVVTEGLPFPLELLVGLCQAQGLFAFIDDAFLDKSIVEGSSVTHILSIGYLDYLQFIG